MFSKSIQRIASAAAGTAFPSSNTTNLEETLDVTRHLPLALVDDKVLDLLIALAYYYDELSNSRHFSLLWSIAC